MTAETVAQQIARALARHGVTCFFGQSLPSALVLACEAIGIRQIAYRQENTGGAMADGFARVSGRVGVVTAQNGPAATLLVAPLAECAKASIPVVALVQEVERPQANRNAFQELDHMALFSAVSKLTRRIDDAKRVDDYVDAAFTAAASGRPGPAVLLLPADLLRETAVAPDHPRAATLGHWPLERLRPDDETVAAAARTLAAAAAPVVIAGGGVLSSGAGAALQTLSDACDLPVFTTNMGKGSVAETHPLACGVTGALNGPRSLGNATREILDAADVVLLVGTRTNQNGTDNWTMIPEAATVIQIDVDPMEIGRTYEAQRLVGDARATLQALTAAMQGLQRATRTTPRPEMERRIAAAWSRFEAERAPFIGANSGPVRPERVMAELQPLLTPDTTVVADASYSSMWIVGQLRGALAGARFLTPRGLAGLGWGLPMAMGAAVARPGTPVVALCGDGGFAHAWAEVETTVRMRIPVVALILNNGVLGFQKDAETVKFGQFTSACRFAPVDHAAIARAVGCTAERIDEPGRVGPALRQALATAQETQAPVLLDIVTDPGAHPPLSIFAKMDA